MMIYQEVVGERVSWKVINHITAIATTHDTSRLTLAIVLIASPSWTIPAVS